MKSILSNSKFSGFENLEEVWIGFDELSQFRFLTANYGGNRFLSHFEKIKEKQGEFNYNRYSFEEKLELCYVMMLCL